MASGDLYEVERIVDKRRNKKGKWEYLIRWKGYGSKEDTWEPEHHLLHCEEFIDHFNSLQIHSHKQPKIPKSTANGHSAATENSRARAEVRKKKSGSEPAFGVRVGTILGIPGGGSAAVHRQRKVGEGLGRHALRDKMSKAMTFKTPSLGAPRFVDPMRKPYNGLQNGDVEPHMYRTASRSHRASSDRVNGDQKEIDTTELDSPLADGKMQLHSSAKRKMAEEKCYVFDKRLRYNVRQNESNCRFRDIVVRKEDGFTHILLSSQTTDNNALTPEQLLQCGELGSLFLEDRKRTYDPTHGQITFELRHVQLEYI